MQMQEFRLHNQCTRTNNLKIATAWIDDDDKEMADKSASKLHGMTASIDDYWYL